LRKWRSTVDGLRHRIQDSAAPGSAGANVSEATVQRHPSAVGDPFRFFVRNEAHAILGQSDDLGQDSAVFIKQRRTAACSGWGAFDQAKIADGCLAVEPAREQDAAAAVSYEASPPSDRHLLERRFQAKKVLLNHHDALSPCRGGKRPWPTS
jgi:hypothetical protein